MTKTYRSIFDRMLVDEHYHGFLDFVSQYCDSFTLDSYCGKQLWSDSDLAESANARDSLTAVGQDIKGSRELFDSLINRHSANGGALDARYLLEIPEYSSIRNNLISVAVINKRTIHCRTRYTFHLNKETLSWLKSFDDIFAIEYAADRSGQARSTENYEQNEYDLLNLSFISKGKVILSSLSSEQEVKIYDDFIEAFDTYIDKIKNEKIEKFKLFRNKFLNLKDHPDNTDEVHTLITDFEPEMFTPFSAVKMLKTCEPIDNEIENFFYEPTNMSLFAELSIKANATHNRPDLFFNWFCKQPIGISEFVKRPLNGETLIRKGLLDMDKDRLIRIIENKLYDTLIREADIYFIDRIIRIIEELNISLNSFPMHFYDLIYEWCETMPNKNDDLKFHVKQTVLSFMYRDKIKRQVYERYIPNKFSGFIKRYGDSDNVSEYAKCKIAYHFYYGYGVRKNRKKAYEGFLKLADTFPDCQYDLAKCYLNGWGTEKDIEQAKHWFEVAAMNGHPKAREQLDRIMS
jgi:hypothetical protein